MRSEFPLPEIQTEFGLLPDPSIDLPVKTLRGYRIRRFLLDTGADLTMIPRSAADELGADIENAPEIEIVGIRRSPMLGRLAQITLRIGGAEVDLPCVFCYDESTPLLLGRMGLFQRFNIAFDNRRKRIVFESI